MFFHSSDAPAERPADPAVRRANMRRIRPLFAPYKRRLGGLLGLIVFTAALGVVPAFLLKHVLQAILTGNHRALSLNAKDGTVRWKVAVADAQRGYWTSMSPLIIRNHVLVGVSGDFDNLTGFVNDPRTWGVEVKTKF